MQFLVSIFSGLAASVLFWMLDRQLLSLQPSTQIGGMIVVFAICGAIGFWWSKKTTEARTKILSGSTLGGELETQMKDVKIEGSGPKDILSDNKIAGKTKITIENAEIKG